MNTSAFDATNYKRIILTDAIKQSVDYSRIVNLEYNPDIADALRKICDDRVVDYANNRMEFWGFIKDGAWRIHLINATE